MSFAPHIGAQNFVFLLTDKIIRGHLRFTFGVSRTRA